MFEFKNICEEELQFFRQGGVPHRESGLFGMILAPEDCAVHVLGVPWSVSDASECNPSQCPQKIVHASHQTPSYDCQFGEVYRYGVHYTDLSEQIGLLNNHSQIIQKKLQNQRIDSHEQKSLLYGQLDRMNREVTELVYKEACVRLKNKHAVGVLGGEQSVAYGLLSALSDSYAEPFAILHLSSGHALKNFSLEKGCTRGSLMAEVLKTLPQVEKLIQIGVRQYSFEEKCTADEEEKIECYYDHEIQRELHIGTSFAGIVADVMDSLPAKVYVAWDISALTPEHGPLSPCQQPSGLSFGQSIALLEGLVKANKKIIGFDLCNIGCRDATDWDLQIGAQVLYKLCGALLNSWELK